MSAIWDSPRLSVLKGEGRVRFASDEADVPRPLTSILSLFLKRRGGF